MLERLSLRLRVFLFFCLLAFGGLAIVGGALFLGYQRALSVGVQNGFVLAGLLIAFGLVALNIGIWLLFDENVAKPVERLAAGLRARAHGSVGAELDQSLAPYLGDLAPAASAITGELVRNAQGTAEVVATQTARLAAEKAQLAALLTEIPVAMILVNAEHRIVLYDGQAAGALSQVAPMRLHASIFDYLDRKAVESAYRQLVRTGMEVAAPIDGAGGALRFDARLKPLTNAPGYLLVLDDTHARIAPEAARPLVYDFDLLAGSGADAMEDRPLSELCFAVFDTETTGLLPHKDEVVQLGAVRVLRGRIIEGEELDLLVDPGMPIPPASTKVHKVSDAMVAGAPDIAEVGRTFHHFASDAVIVAHNAPFDMAFLRRHAGRMEVEWTQPILDTVLLSAVLFGASERHTLDALCDRLGITIPERLRHTALGDARATAEVLCRMLPMLEARGLTRFGQVIAETRRHGRLLEDLN
jgi:DNA polymerase-3 subunit epsilon